MTVTTTDEGHVPVPSDLRRAAGIEPGTELDIELTDSGLLVRPKSAADAEDAEDLAAAESALAELEASGGEPVAWDEIKQRHGL